MQERIRYLLGGDRALVPLNSTLTPVHNMAARLGNGKSA